MFGTPSHDLQDIFSLMPRYSQRPAKEEVINDPTVTKHYWRYRCVCEAALPCPALCHRGCWRSAVLACGAVQLHV